MKVIKRDGRAVDYNREKIAIAIEKANKEVKPKEKKEFSNKVDNSIKEIDICPIELDDYIDGYKIISHSLVIDGICKRCQGEEKTSLLCSL